MSADNPKSDGKGAASVDNPVLEPRITHTTSFTSHASGESLTEVDLTSPSSTRRPVQGSESGSQRDLNYVIAVASYGSDMDNLDKDGSDKDISQDLALKTESDARGKHGFWSAVSNYVNSIVGAGILGIAFSTRETGMMAGILLMLFTAYMTDYSSRLLVRLGERSGFLGYEEVAMSTLGHWGKLFVLLTMLLFAYGTMFASLLLIADTVPVILKHWTGFVLLGNRQFTLGMTSLFTCFPLAIRRDIGELGSASAFSVFLVAVLCVIVAIQVPPSQLLLRQSRVESGFATRNDEAIDNVNIKWIINDRIVTGSGTIIFSFVCHHSCFLVRNSLREPRQWPIVTHTSLGAALVLTMTMALVGYGTFGDCTRPNILNNYSADNEAANCARLFVALALLLTYPMEFFVARHAINTILWDTPPTLTRHIFISLFVFGTTLFVGMILRPDDLAPVLSITGGTCAAMLGFIGPALCFFGYESQVLPRRSASCYIMPSILVLVGSVAFVASLYVAIKDFAGGGGYTPKPYCPSTGL